MAKKKKSRKQHKIANKANASNQTPKIQQFSPSAKTQVIIPEITPNFPLASGLKQEMPTNLTHLSKASYKSAALNISGGNIDAMVREYNRILIEKGYGLARTELLKKDLIDARGLFDLTHIEPWQAPNPNGGLDDKLWLIQNYWYACVPCFPEGVIQVNRKRYIYWKLTDISIEENRMLLYLKDYVFYDDTGWQIGVSGSVAWTFGDPESEIMSAIKEERQMKMQYARIPDDEWSFERLYTALDLNSDLHWSPRQQQLWKESVLKFARLTAQKFWDAKQKTALDDLAELFTGYMLRVNYVLDRDKQEKSVRAGNAEERKAEDRKRQAQKAAGQKPVPERRIRTIGAIQITSIQKPCASTAKSPANYTKASWKSRGHIRTYKNGKRVYVKESVHHRKALRNKDDGIIHEPTPITIRITPPPIPETDDKGENKNA